jgi:hypothetical protein
MSCRGKAMHALGECDCYLKPRDFLTLPESERRWFEILMRLTRRHADTPRASKPMPSRSCSAIAAGGCGTEPTKWTP